METQDQLNSKNLADEKELLLTQIKNNVNEFYSKSQYLNYYINKNIQSILEEQKIEKSKTEEEYKIIEEQIRDNYRKNFKELNEKFLKLNESMGYGICRWNDDKWNKYKVSLDMPTVLRIGKNELKFENNNEKVERLDVPYCIPFNGDKRNLILNISTDSEKLLKEAKEGFQTIVLRLMAIIPNSKFKLHILDSDDFGMGLKSISKFRDYVNDSKIFEGNISDVEAMEDKLRNINVDIKSTLEKFNTKYQNIEDYNKDKDTKRKKEYNILVISDVDNRIFRNSHNRESIGRIVRNASKCGYYTFILVNSLKLDRDVLKDNNFQDIFENSRVIEYAENNWKISNFKSKYSTFYLDNLFKENNHIEILNNLLSNVSISAKTVFNQTLTYDELKPNEVWTKYSDEGIDVNFGENGEKLVNINLYENDSHCIVLGNTGMGKGTTLRMMIMNMALSYSPEEVQLYIFDMKTGGGDYNLYTKEGHELPHAKVIVSGNNPEILNNILNNIVPNEFERRATKFSEIGCNNNIREYKQKARECGYENLPRILILIDEYHNIFSCSESLKNDILNKLSKIAKEGRSYGIHLLMCDQVLGELPKSIYSQMTNRILFYCEFYNLDQIINESYYQKKIRNPKEMPPFKGVYHKGNLGESDFETTPICSQNSDYESDLLESIRLKADGYEKYKKLKPRFFDFNRSILAEFNTEIIRNIEKYNGKDKEAFLYLGTPMSLEPSMTMSFKRVYNRNLIIFSRNKSAICGMISCGILSLVAQYNRDVEIYFFNDDMDDESANLKETLTLYYDDDILVKNKNDFKNLTIELKNIICDRQTSNDYTDIYLIINGFNREQHLNDDNLQYILKNGSKYGVYLICALDSIKEIDSHPCKENFSMITALSIEAKSINGLESAIKDAFKTKGIDPNNEKSMEAICFTTGSKECKTFIPYEQPSEDVIEDCFDLLS